MEPRSALPIEESCAELEEDRDEREEDDVRLVAARKALELVLTPDTLPLEEPLDVAMAGVLEEELLDELALDWTVELDDEDDELEDPPPPPERPPRPRPLRLPRIIGAIREA